MKARIYMFLFTVIVCVESKGQKEIFYYGANTKPVEQLSEAMEYAEVDRKSERKYVIRNHQKVNNKWVLVNKEKIRIKNDGSQTVFYNEGTFFPRKFYRETEIIGSGQYSFKETEGGGLRRTGAASNLIPIHLEGLVTEYHSNGKIKSRSHFRNNQLLYNENWLNDGLKYIDSVFYSVDIEPEYQPGDGFFKNYLIQNLANSKMDLTQFEDQVVIGWVVMETGKLEGAIALQGKSEQLNQFLVNTISEMPGAWDPGQLEGKPVRCFMSIPLNFIHQGAHFQDVELSSGILHYNRY